MKSFKILLLCAGVLGATAMAQAQGFAPATLSDVIFNGTILTSTGGAAATGNISSLLSSSNIDYTLQSNGSLTDPAPFGYSKQSPTVGQLVESPVGALPGVRVTLTFTSGTAGTFSAAFDGGGTQTGNFTLVPIGTTAPLVNVSSLTRLGSGGSATAGFVIAGTSPRKILVRAIGPTLSQYAVPSPLSNPVLTVWNGMTAVATNDDWNSGPNPDPTLAAAFSQVGAFGLPAGSKDAAIVLTLNPGVYSAQVAGTGTDSGAVLMEVYLLQ